jgi:hypothetical protein
LSYLWIDYLVTRFGKGNLLKFVAGLSKSGEKIEEAFERIYGEPLIVVEKQYIKSIKKGKGGD